MRMAAAEAGVREPWLPIPFPLAYAFSFATEILAFLSGSEWPAFPMHGLQMLRHTPAVSNARARKELGWCPGPVQDAVARAIAWYREQGWIRESPEVR
jgi:dihydroflavonol-4-reductase